MLTNVKEPLEFQNIDHGLCLGSRKQFHIKVELKFLFLYFLTAWLTTIRMAGALAQWYVHNKNLKNIC